VAEDPYLLGLADGVPPPQFATNVFLASVHDLLLGGADHPLANRYPSVCARRGLPSAPFDEERLVASFAAFCHEHEREVVERCATRATQTNEVSRSSVLRGALAAIGAAHPRVALVDLGCSAGLNLFVDAYAYRYDARPVLGPPGATPVLECELRGPPPPVDLPAITARIGVDLAPVDATDETAIAWLLACLWPDDTERFVRLDQAIAVAAARHGEVSFVVGDMVRSVRPAASLVDGDSPIVFLDSWSAAYLERPRRAELARELGELSTTRDVTLVSMEFPRVLVDLGVLDAAATVEREASAVTIARFSEGRVTSTLVAECHPHGRWLAWRG